MNHWSFVVIAYSSFAILLLWDYIAPQFSLKKSKRDIALRLRRKKPL